MWCVTSWTPILFSTSARRLATENTRPPVGAMGSGGAETSALKHHHRCTLAPEPIDQKFQRTAEQSKPAESGERIIDGEIACVDAEGRSSFNELLIKSAKMLGPLDVECVNLLHAGVAEQERRIVGS